MGKAMRHPLHDVNPSHLDMGEVIALRTGDYLAEATAGQAAACLKAERHAGVGSGAIWYETLDGEKILARVMPREGTDIRDFRLAVALKLRDEKSIGGREGMRRQKAWLRRNAGQAGPGPKVS
jgi:hypothetical protein